MTTEITLVRLPVQLSDLIDEVVGEFVETHAKEGMQAHRRYHGADLWMVYAHTPAGEAAPAFVTRRVTVAAYSDDPDHLRFIPDIVVTGPHGRATLPFSADLNGLRGYVDAISVLQVRLVVEGAQLRRELKDARYFGGIAAALEHAWVEARRLQPEQASQLIT